MKIRRVRSVRHCRSYCLSLCLCLSALFVTVRFLLIRRVPECHPRSPETAIVDQEDEWQYQNSISGKWYHWRTGSKRRPDDKEWGIKWLNVAPSSSLGVIVYLSRASEINTLKVSLKQLNRLFLLNNPRPVVIFHQGDLADASIQHSLALIVGSRTPLAFECIHFSNTSKPISRRRYQRSYYDMCRFFIIMLPTHPLLALFEFFWRLDTHSYIFGSTPIDDPFELMQQKQIQYAFTMAEEDAEHYVNDLWSLFHQFLDRYCLKPSPAVRQTQTGWFGGYSMAIFYTNFAISNVSFWRDNVLVRAWLQTVDRHGGIYRHRWGDAPIHTLILNQLLDRDEILRLRHFGYMHQREYACAADTRSDLCDRQVKFLLTNSTTEYLRYEDGCKPRDNSLCHYYSALR